MEEYNAAAQRFYAFATACIAANSIMHEHATWEHGLRMFSQEMDEIYKSVHTDVVVRMEALPIEQRVLILNTSLQAVQHNGTHEILGGNVPSTTLIDAVETPADAPPPTPTNADL